MTAVEPGAESLRVALRSRAIRLLSRREHSRAELRRKLLASAGDDGNAGILDQVLDDLEAGRWLSDERFAEAFVRSREARLGGGRIAQELSARGIDRGLAAELIAPLREAEIDRAWALWLRRFGVVPVDHKDRARQGRFLVQRGFTESVVRRVLDRARTRVNEAPDGSDPV